MTTTSEGSLAREMLLASSMAAGESRGEHRGPRLLERVALALETRHYSARTVEAYVGWVRRFVLFHGRRHPREMGAPEVAQFLSGLAVEGQVSSSTQNQALAALLFLYSAVLERDLGRLPSIVNAKRPATLPGVMTPDEVSRLLSKLGGVERLMASLLYGTGMRLMECATLRVKDLDFDSRTIAIRRGKGARDRMTLLPESLTTSLKAHVAAALEQHERDLERGGGFVIVPFALRRKYPNVARDWRWQWVFPATRTYVCSETGEQRRHHLHETVLQRSIRSAARLAGIEKHVSCHTLRHSFATHLLQSGYDIRTIQKLLGHRDLRTTMVYTHVVQRGPLGVVSPLDRLA